MTADIVERWKQARVDADVGHHALIDATIAEIESLRSALADARGKALEEAAVIAENSRFDINEHNVNSVLPWSAAVEGSVNLCRFIAEAIRALADGKGEG